MIKTKPKKNNFKMNVVIIIINSLNIILVPRAFPPEWGGIRFGHHIWQIVFGKYNASVGYSSSFSPPTSSIFGVLLKRLFLLLK